MKKPRKQAEIDKIRDHILEKALDIIVQKGFSSLTMRAIASKTGMTAPNIYNYFSGKDEIYITLVIRGFQLLHDKLRSALALSDDPLDRAMALAGAYLDFGLENPSYYDIMFTQPAPKYDDYVGTAHEELSEVEYKISMDIAALAENAARAVLPGSGLEVQHRLVAIWSLLHGMVALHNSKVVSYVAPDVKGTYALIMEELFNLYVPRSAQPAKAAGALAAQ